MQFGAGRPIKHPRWNLQPTVRVGCSQVAAKDNSARPLNCLMSADPQARPWMPRIQQLPKLGTVGVLKPCCTTLFERTCRCRRTRLSCALCTQSDVSSNGLSSVDCIINMSGFDFREGQVFIGRCLLRFWLYCCKFSKGIQIIGMYRVHVIDGY